MVGGEKSFLLGLAIISFLNKAVIVAQKILVVLKEMLKRIGKYPKNFKLLLTWRRNEGNNGRALYSLIHPPIGLQDLQRRVSRVWSCMLMR